MNVNNLSITTLVNFYPRALTPISHSALNFTITILEDKLAVFLFSIIILYGMVVNPSNYPVSSVGSTYYQPKPIITY